MFSWLKKKAGASRVLGLDMYEDGCALAAIDQTDVGRPVITGVRWCPFEPGEKKAFALRSAVRDLKARNLPVVATLSHKTA